MKKLLLGTVSATILMTMLALSGSFSVASAQATSDATPVPTNDYAAAVIVCSAKVETQALNCKRKQLAGLESCLESANSAAANAKCDAAALGGLRQCQATGIAGDLGCYINPGPPSTLNDE